MSRDEKVGGVGLEKGALNLNKLYEIALSQRKIEKYNENNFMLQKCFCCRWMLLYSLKCALIATSLLMKILWGFFRNFLVSYVPVSQSILSTERFLNPSVDRYLGIASQISSISFVERTVAEHDFKMM